MTSMACRLPADGAAARGAITRCDAVRRAQQREACGHQQDTSCCAALRQEPCTTACGRRMGSGRPWGAGACGGAKHAERGDARGLTTAFRTRFPARATPNDRCRRRPMSLIEARAAADALAAPRVRRRGPCWGAGDSARRLAHIRSPHDPSTLTRHGRFPAPRHHPALPGAARRAPRGAPAQAPLCSATSGRCAPRRAEDEACRLLATRRRCARARRTRSAAGLRPRRSCRTSSPGCGPRAPPPRPPPQARRYRSEQDEHLRACLLQAGCHDNVSARPPARPPTRRPRAANGWRSARRPALCAPGGERPVRGASAGPFWRQRGPLARHLGAPHPLAGRLPGLHTWDGPVPQVWCRT